MNKETVIEQAEGKIKERYLLVDKNKTLEQVVYEVCEELENFFLFGDEAAGFDIELSILRLRDKAKNTWDKKNGIKKPNLLQRVFGKSLRK